MPRVLALFLISLTLLAPSAVYADQQESHFVDAWRTKHPLPIGANIASVREFLEKKIMLRKDVGGVPLKSLEAQDRLFLARSLPAGSYLVEGAVVLGLPETMKAQVPPTRSLFTVVLPAEVMQDLSLCRPYERASLTLFNNSKKELEIDQEVLLVSSTLPSREGRSSSQGLEQTKGIVVLALREKDFLAAKKMYREGSSRIQLDCFNQTKYE